MKSDRPGELTCMFTCHGCRATRVEFTVRERGPAEPIVPWMEFTVRPAMAAAHTAQAPWCKSTNADLWISLADDKPIGSVVPRRLVS